MVAIHKSKQLQIETLQAGFMMRNGIDPVNPLFATDQAWSMLHRAGMEWIYELNRDLKGRGRSNLEGTLDTARRLHADKPIRTCERLLEIRGRGAVPSNPDVIVERSFGTSYLPRVFGAYINAGMILGYLEYADSTKGWTDEADWNDFKENQPIGIDPSSKLQLHTRGTVAKDLEFVDLVRSTRSTDFAENGPLMIRTSSTTRSAPMRRCLKAWRNGGISSSRLGLLGSDDESNIG